MDSMQLMGQQFPLESESCSLCHKSSCSSTKRVQVA